MSDDPRYDRTTDPDRVEPAERQPVEARPADVAADERPVTTETASSSGVAATTTSESAPEHGREIPRDPSSERVVSESSGPGGTTDWNAHTGLLPDDDLGTYQKRWDDIQVGFIDEPRQSVRSADDLVGEVTHQIAQRFTNARQQLEQRWDSGDDPTTEELRQAVQRYRDFFQRLVAR